MTYGMRRMKPVKVRGNRRIRVYLWVFAITVFLLFYLSANLVILTLEKKVWEVRKKNEEVALEISHLEFDVAGLKKGSRIKKIAHEQLGLEMPEGAPEKLF
ncbi:hypothetical protein LLG96_11090 [bacterium]|nr:hypothetical protein [bacterium]